MNQEKYIGMDVHDATISLMLFPHRVVGGWVGKIRLFSQFQFSLRRVESWHTVGACKSRGLW
jgi:hypothetical protein